MSLLITQIRGGQLHPLAIGVATFVTTVALIFTQSGVGVA